MTGARVVYIEVDCLCLRPDDGHTPGNPELVCYDGTINRGDAVNLLHGFPKGSYLVRTSSEGTNKYSLSVVVGSNKDIHHYLVINDKGTYRLNERQDKFCCLQSLLYYYSQNANGVISELSLPVFTGSLYHKIEIWEYQTTSGHWETFPLQQMYRLSTLSKSETPIYQFEDRTVVNLNTRTREVPCIYGEIKQNVRVSTAYALCLQCSLSLNHPLVSRKNLKKALLSVPFNQLALHEPTTNFKSPNSTADRMSRFMVWQYYDTASQSWRYFDTGKFRFQHLLTSHRVLNATTNEQSTFTISDSNRSQWFFNLSSMKAINLSTMKSYDLRQHVVHGVTVNNVHSEKTKYLSVKQPVLKTLRANYCGRMEHGCPLTWTSSPTQPLAFNSSEYQIIAWELRHARGEVSRVTRIQSRDLWRINSKELQLQKLMKHSSVKDDLFWSECSLTDMPENLDASKILNSLCINGIYQFCKNPEDIRSGSCVALVKVIYDESNIIQSKFLRLIDQEAIDRIYPLFIAFCPPLSSDVDNNADIGIKKTLGVKSITFAT